MNLKLILTGSVIANVALVAAIALKSPSTFGLGSSASAQAAAEAAVVAKNAQAAAQAVPAGISTELWKKVYSSDPKTLVENLRAAGFPPKLIRAILATELSAIFKERRKALLGTEELQPYWKTGKGSSMFTNYSMIAKMNALGREEREQLNQLLGPEGKEMDESFSIYGRRTYGNIPAEKMQTLQRLQSDYSELRYQIYGEANGVYLPEDREKLALLEKEQRADLVAALTPEELKEYDMRNSTTAQRMRSQYSAFNFNEQEFQDVYAAMSTYDQKFSQNQYLPGAGYSGFDEKTQAERTAADKAMQETIKASLGETRYQEFQRASDAAYRSASLIAERLQLPAESANGVYELRKTVEAQMRATMTNRELSQEARKQAMEGLVADTNAKLDQLLTAKGAAAFKQSSGGMMLNSLSRAATMSSRIPAGVVTRPNN